MAKTIGNGTSASLGWGDDGRPGVAFMIPETTFVTTVDGEPHSGIVLSSAAAKEIAYVLLLLAQQLENGIMPAYPTPR